MNLTLQSGLTLALLASGAAGPIHAAAPVTLPAQQSIVAVNGDSADMSSNTTLDVRAKIQGSSAFTGLAWSPDGGRLAAYADFGRAVQVWNAAGVEQKQLARTGAYIGNSIEFLSGGRELITPAADASAAGDKLALSVWDVDHGAIAQNVAGPQPTQNWRYNRAVAFALSPDGATLGLISSPLLGQPVTLYATKDWTKQRSIAIGDGPAHPDGAQAVAFAPDGRTLAIGLLSGKVMLVDLSQPNAPPRTIEIYPATNLTGVQALAFSPDGKMLATGSTKPSVERGDAAPGVEVRSVADGSLVAAHPTSLAPVRQLVWCHDGRLVIAAGDDTLRVWSPASPQHDLASIRLSGPVMSAAIAPDGRALAAAGGSEVIVFSLPN